jgi:hypothetical protein
MSSSRKEIEKHAAQIDCDAAARALHADGSSWNAKAWLMQEQFKDWQHA